MKKSRLSTLKQNKLIEYFVAGVTARCATDLVGANRKAGGYYFHRLIDIIFLNLSQEAEAYFCGRRKGRRGRGAAGQVPVFGLFPALNGKNYRL